MKADWVDCVYFLFPRDQKPSLCKSGPRPKIRPQILHTQEFSFPIPEKTQKKSLTDLPPIHTLTVSSNAQNSPGGQYSTQF